MPLALIDYPRPPEDTGIGVHWSASNSFGGMAEFADDNPRIVMQARRMGKSWGKILAGGTNATGTCRLLLDNHIMPIVRFYEPAQWPDPLSSRQDLAALVRAYVAVGVKYFEVGNEPNLLEEWKGGWGTSDADPTPWKEGAQPDRVAQAFVTDARIVLDNGGLPGLPACSPGGHYNDIDFFRTMCQRLYLDGHAGLLGRGCWIALHNAMLNHPLDYPDDPVNQLGKQLTREEYERHSTWAGSMEWVNAERLRGQNKGQHLLSVDATGKDMGGSNCWRKFEALRTIFRSLFSFDVPVLSTEGGPWVGTKLGEEPYEQARIYDPRYPAVSIEQHRDWITEICRTMMAGGYPSYYFCTGFWLWANQGMGGQHKPFERDAWFSPVYWENGHLPVVEALEALPKQARPWTEGPDLPVPVDLDPPLPRILPDEEIARLCLSKGFTGLALQTMVAIILAESGGNASAYNPFNPDGGVDRGLVQIHDLAHPDVQPVTKAYDPDFACEYAWHLSQGGTYWGHWVAYNVGAYLNFWDRAGDAIVLVVTEPSQEELTAFALEQCMGIPYTPGFALMKAGLAAGLTPVSREGRGTIQCGPYVGACYAGNGELVLFYCRDKDWGNVKRRTIGRW